ncbi:hypothetical protein FACS1894113_3250 [Alphaproteobacteria bacterium]|nr:hypothetical protein FACS1894113_3250 [Alphaproteobacteria bacterium]
MRKPDHFEAPVHCPKQHRKTKAVAQKDYAVKSPKTDQSWIAAEKENPANLEIAAEEENPANLEIDASPLRLLL